MRRPQNLKKSPTCFDKTVVFKQQHQNKWEIFSNFCGLFRKAGLYHCTTIPPYHRTNVPPYQCTTVPSYSNPKNSLTQGLFFVVIVNEINKCSTVMTCPEPAFQKCTGSFHVNVPATNKFLTMSMEFDKKLFKLKLILH